MKTVIQQVTDHITLIEGGDFPRSNSLFIDDEILIDTGTGISDLSPRLIINSHCHPDHTSGNHHYSVPIFAHRLDAPLIRDFEVMKREQGVSGSGWPEMILRLTGWKPSHAEELSEETVFHTRNTEVRMIHTPGHSPGHLCIAADGVLFTADIDLTGFGPWYGFENSDIDQFISSIQRVIDMKPEVIVTGHRGLVDRNIEGELHRYMEMIHSRDIEILERLDSDGSTLEELATQAVIYRRFPPPKGVFQFHETVMVRKHLERLRERGLACKKNGKWYPIP